MLYVLYTMSGKEEEIITLLNSTIVETAPDDKAGTVWEDRIPSWKEYFFIPKTEFTRKWHGQEQKFEQPLYPGYVFFNTSTPVDFFQRARNANFMQTFGKFFKVLKIDIEDPDCRQFKREDFYSEEDYKDYLEKKFSGYLARLSDQEEKDVLEFCGLKRNEMGDIVKINEVLPTSVYSAMQTGFFIPNYELQSLFAPPSEDESKSFTIHMSQALKIVRKGSVPAQRKPGDVRYLVYRGPLIGREKSISYVDAHKRIARVKTIFMHREVDVKVPLEIVKTVEMEQGEMEKFFSSL